MTTIYTDNAATTRVRAEVFEAMKPYFEQQYGNPSGVYSIARDSKNAMEDARDKVAKGIKAKPEEIYFTGSGTEADNWAILGIMESYAPKGGHIITTEIEHHAVLHTCKYLEKKGYDMTYLPVDKQGIINIDDLKNAIRKDTVLITIMFANNEIGTLQPVAEIGAIAREKKILFHTDAVQALGSTYINVVEMKIDLLSLSGHKIYAPKGVGVLYVRKGVRLKPIIHGGGQERNRRAGTENVPSIVAMGKAVELITNEMDDEIKRLINIRNMLIDRILAEIPYTRLNGSRDKRLPGNVNISFEFIEGESLLLLLDMKGIYASSGSACTSGSLDPSHVLLAIGLPHEEAHGSLRLSLGKYNKEEDVEIIVKELLPIVERLREMSPLYEDFVKNKK